MQSSSVALGGDTHRALDDARVRAMLAELHQRALQALSGGGIDARSAGEPRSASTDSAVQFYSDATLREAAVAHAPFIMRTAVTASLAAGYFGAFNFYWHLWDRPDGARTDIAIVRSSPLTGRRADHDAEALVLHMQRAFDRDWVAARDARCAHLLQRTRAWLANRPPLPDGAAEPAIALHAQTAAAPEPRRRRLRFR